MRKGTGNLPVSCLLSEDLLTGPGGHLGPMPTQTPSNSSSVLLLGRQELCREEVTWSGFLLDIMDSQIPNSLYLAMICGINIQVTMFLGLSDDRDTEH